MIAGLIGLFVGWLFGPDVNDIEEAQTARFDQLDARVAALQAPIAGLQTALTAQAASNPTEAITALAAKVDASAAASTASKASGDAIAASVSALQTKLDAMAAAPPPVAAPAAGNKADALAAQIGNTGAVLLAGQTAIFGDKRLTLAAVNGDKASLGAEGAAPSEVASGAKVDLGAGCSVTLAGVSGTAAYLAPTNCSTSASAGASTAAAPTPTAAAAPAAPAPAAPAPAAPAPAASAPAPTAPAPAAPSPDGTPITVGQTATFGTKGVFLTRLAATEGKAFLFIPGSKGKGQIPAATGTPTDLGDGCSVTLVKIEGTTATFKANGCGGDTAAAAAPAAPAAPAPAAPAAAPVPAAPAPAAAAAPAPAAPAPAAPAPAAAATGEAPSTEPPAPTQATAGGPAALTIGQTATFGKQRLFLSRLTPEKAFVVVVGSGNKDVALGAALDLGGGCSAKFDGINDKTANFTPTGC